MFITPYLYDLLERQIEEAANYNVAIKEFVGLAVDERAPNHSTPSEFNRRLRAVGGWDNLRAVCDEVLCQARAAVMRLVVYKWLIVNTRWSM